MRLALILLVAWPCVAGASSAPAAAMPQLSAEECEVWQRELSFADSVAEHDATAFAAHVGEHAAFGSGRPEPIRGRAAIVERWSQLIEGKEMKLRWYPTRVTIAGVEGVAWSSGPALTELLDTNARDRYLIGNFRSVWHRDADGVWRVLFDDGEPPRPATPREVTVFNEGRRDCAPAGGG